MEDEEAHDDALAIDGVVTGNMLQFHELGNNHQGIQQLRSLIDMIDLPV